MIPDYPKDLIKPPYINEFLVRKGLLITRDPLGREVNDRFAAWLSDRKNKQLWRSIEELWEKIKAKWHIRIYVPETTLQGATTHWGISGNYYEAIRDARQSADVIIGEDGKIDTASFHHNNLIFCPPDQIPLIIDPSVLTLNDAKEIKKIVWEIISDEIKKLQIDQTNGWNPTLPKDEPEMLNKIFRCKTSTFETYLRWYDLKDKGLTFRLISFIETENRSQKARDQAFATAIKAKRVPRVGKPVGEDKIRKGYNLIWQAIHRAKAPSKESQIDTMSKYFCPKHGSDCPANCDYLMNWLSEFDKRHRSHSQRELLTKKGYLSNFDMFDDFDDYDDFN